MAQRRSGGRKKSIRAKLTLRLNKAQQLKAKKCLERSGRIVIGFKKISVTKLPKVLTPFTVIED